VGFERGASAVTGDGAAGGATGTGCGRGAAWPVSAVAEAPGAVIGAGERLSHNAPPASSTTNASSAAGTSHFRLRALGSEWAGRRTAVVADVPPLGVAIASSWCIT
jgi:hypothetical protein